MRKSLWALVLAAIALPASAVGSVICDSCDYINGQVATNLGLYNPTHFDNGTFSNATTGQNGNFDNFWVFSINPAGNTAINAIFQPVNNISNFDVKLFGVTSDICAANTGTAGGLCTALTLGALLDDPGSNPNFVSNINFQTLNAGVYAFEVSGTISGLVAGQPASYTGNLQVTPVPEPETYTLVLAGLGVMGVVARRRKRED
jgi:hypothetical protein